MRIQLICASRCLVRWQAIAPVAVTNRNGHAVSSAAVSRASFHRFDGNRALNARPFQPLATADEHRQSLRNRVAQQPITDIDSDASSRPSFPRPKGIRKAAQAVWLKAEATGRRPLVVGSREAVAATGGQEIQSNRGRGLAAWLTATSCSPAGRSKHQSKSIGR